MAVPTFTIVMGVLTCVPFGLAVRETVKGVEKPLTSEERFHLEMAKIEARRAEREAAREAEEAREEAALAAKHAQVIVTLHGPTAGTLGSAFAGVALGGPASAGNELDARLAPLRLAHELDLYALGDGVTLQSMFIKPTMHHDETSAFCTQLEESLTGAWGDAVTDRHDRQIWVNAELAQRAIFDDSDGCELKVEKYTPLARWFDRSPKSIVPLWAIGQPTTRLVASLGARATVEDHEVTWSGLGIGAGVGSTNLRAVVKDGRISAIIASAETDGETQEEVVRHISAVLRSEPTESYSYVWKHRPRVELEGGSAQLTLTLGTLPDEE